MTMENGNSAVEIICLIGFNETVLMTEGIMVIENNMNEE
jgi:hypothetical protein